MRALRNDNPISSTPTQKGMVLVARRSLTLGGKQYPAGAEVNPNALGANYRALFSSHYVEWVPASKVARPVARDLAPAPPAGAMPTQVTIIEDNDPCEAWRLTRDSMTRLCNGDAGKARDLLFADREARELYKRAVTVGTAREAKRRNVPSVSPDQIRPAL